MLDGLKRASPSRITAVVPYYAYGRQDRKIQSRDPITAKLVADLISRAGAQRLLAVDLHADQIQGFFDMPVDNLTAASVLAKSVSKENLVVISPDVGGVVRARTFAKHFNAPIGIIDKRRPRSNENEVMNVIGEVSGMNAVIFDDMIDTGGTISKAASALLEKGALSVTVCASHGVFSGKAFETLRNSKLEQIVVTDSIPLSADAPSKIKQVSIAPLLAQAIKRVHEGKSLSELFKNG
jgi:ribose-phosphate pyrophosphokinase